jgi:hypothetical protein
MCVRSSHRRELPLLEREMSALKDLLAFYPHKVEISAS